MGLSQRAARLCPWFVAGISHNGVSRQAGPTKTVLPTENGKQFVCTGAVTFTLPALAEGLQFVFQQISDNNMVIQSAAGNDIVALNDIAASSVTFSTSSQKIGACLQVECVDTDGAGTLKWLARNLSDSTATIA